MDLSKETAEFVTGSNGKPKRAQRLRIDEFGGPRPAQGGGFEETAGHSGRRAVIVAGLVLLALWGGLWLAFRRWRAGYRERAAFAVAHVVPAIDPLADVAPPGVDPKAWRAAVDDTRAMLLTLATANVLNRAQMEALRADVDARVARARARPETAVDELAQLWDTLLSQAAPILVPRHPRPKLLPPFRRRAK